RQEAVADERGNRLLVARLSTRDDVAQGIRAPLPERSFEARLLAQRLVATSARRAELRERTFTAPGHARGADRRTEVEQRLRTRGVEPLTRALLHSSNVRVDGQHVVPEREVADRRGGIRAHAGQLGQILGPAARGDDTRRAMQVDGAAVVAE